MPRHPSRLWSKEKRGSRAGGLAAIDPRPERASFAPPHEPAAATRPAVISARFFRRAPGAAGRSRPAERPHARSARREAGQRTVARLVRVGGRGGADLLPGERGPARAQRPADRRPISEQGPADLERAAGDLRNPGGLLDAARHLGASVRKSAASWVAHSARQG